MRCAYVHAETPDTLVTCAREGDLVDGVPRCYAHAPSPVGWVYVLVWGSFAKIGYSVDPAARLAQLTAVGNGTIMPPQQEGNVELVGAVPGTVQTERLLQAALGAHRAAGEWFARSVEVDALVEEARRNPVLVPPRPVRAAESVDF
jgi:hypothetical protein